MSSTAPQMPIASYEGMSPIPTVAIPIIVIVMMSSALRPIRSPKWPNKAAPIGRATKPTKKVENERSVPMNGSDPGKNFCGKTVAAAAP